MATGIQLRQRDNALLEALLTQQKSQPDPALFNSPGGTGLALIGQALLQHKLNKGKKEEALQAGVQQRNMADILTGLQSGGMEALPDLLGGANARGGLDPEFQSVIAGLLTGEAQSRADFSREKELLGLEQESDIKVAQAKAANKAPTVRDQKIADLKAQNVSHAEAVKIVDGHIKVTTSPDEFGNVIMTDVVKGESKTISAREAQERGLTVPGTEQAPVAQNTGPIQASDFMTEAMSNAPAQLGPGVSRSLAKDEQAAAKGARDALVLGTDMMKNIESGTGAGNIFQRGVAGVVQPLTLGQFTVFAEEQAAADEIRKFNQMAVAGMVNNPRAPVAEQALIRKFLPNPDSITTTPEVEAINFLQTQRMLLQTIENTNAFTQGRPPRQIKRDYLGTENDPIQVDTPADQLDASQYTPGTFIMLPDGTVLRAQ